MDDEPALDTYLRMFGRTTTDVTADTFAYFAATHPLGISRRSGEEVRVVGTADFTERSVQTWSRVPRGGMTWLMEGNADTMQQAAVDPCADVVEDLGGVPPIGALAFDCMGRRSVLGDEGMVKEVASMAAGIGAPIAGLYTYGEIARIRGANGFHNQTLVMVAFG